MTAKKEIPYKIYLEEQEMPQAWYNVRADMKNKPAPLLNPATLQPMTAEELQSFNEAAVLEVDGQVVPTDKIRYSYKKSGWGCDATSELPTEPGTYVQTAEIGGNYSCSKISRNITVK